MGENTVDLVGTGIIGIVTWSGSVYLGNMHSGKDVVPLAIKRSAVQILLMRKNIHNSDSAFAKNL